MKIEFLIVLLLFNLVSMQMVLNAYSLGLKNGLEKAKEEEVTLPSIVPKKEERTDVNSVLSDGERLFELSMQNIENYDGTGRGQKEVK